MITTITQKDREQETLSPTDFVASEQIGRMPKKRKDDLVPFEMRDLIRIERKLERAKLGEKSKDYQNLAYLCGGTFFTILTFLVALLMTILVPMIVLVVSVAAMVLSLILIIVFWTTSSRLGRINENYIEEILEEIRHLKDKFLYVTPNDLSP